jgi:catechol 2,3-dioxygenase-like lactoylglutathione lyase family enzyme
LEHAPSGIHHFAIKVHDLVAAEAFYCGILGLAVVTRWRYPARPDTRGEGPGERSLWVATGDAAGGFLALERLDADPSAPRPPVAAGEAPTGGARADANADANANAPAESAGHHLLALRIRTEDRPAWEDRLRRAGVAVTHRTAFTIYFADPEGNRLGLSHHPEPALGLSGGGGGAPDSAQSAEDPAQQTSRASS